MRPPIASMNTLDWDIFNQFLLHDFIAVGRLLVLLHIDETLVLIRPTPVYFFHEGPFSLISRVVFASDYGRWCQRVTNEPVVCMCCTY